jgi:hypothetical protein
MWTNEKAAIETVDQSLFELIGISSLQGNEWLYTRNPRPERWSDGLAKNLFEVVYHCWRPWQLTRFLWDPKTETLGDLETFNIDHPPADWAPSGQAVADERQMSVLRSGIQARLGQEVRISHLNQRPLLPTEEKTTFESRLWTVDPKEEILIRHDADTGALLGWRHATWFSDEPGPATDQPVGNLNDVVEALDLFPQGMKPIDDWPASDRGNHHELLWTRYHEDEEVENDTLFASVNRQTRRVAECVLNWSDLDHDLDLDSDEAASALDVAFAQHFPEAVRCGIPRRLYIELPGQTKKKRAWAANAIDDAGPVQICIGNGGQVLRVDSVV